MQTFFTYVHMEHPRPAPQESLYYYYY